MEMEYRIIKVAELKPFHLRDLRGDVIRRLRTRIAEGYNPARPLSVVADNGSFIVADGNHRLQVLNELKIEEAPCLVREGDIYSIAIKCNEDEDTYAPLDLFDWLDIVKQLRNEGLTQAQIGERIGWSESAVKQYGALLNKIVTQVLNLAKQHQAGRVTEKVTNVTFTFTEGWFRTSGLYDLCDKYQQQLMEMFVADKCKWNKEKVQKESAKFTRWQGYTALAETALVNADDLPGLIAMIENDVFKTEAQLQQKIKDLNGRAKNKLICGDCIAETESLNDASIDIVITDPPYGIDYSSNRSQFLEHVTKEKIENDGDLKQALDLFEKVLEILNRKTKPDAHLYIFTSWKVCQSFVDAVSKYFIVKNLLIWDKGNHGSGD